MTRKISFMLYCLLTLATSTLNAQTDDKCVSKGKFIIDAYYGYPYFVGKYLVYEVASSRNTSNEKFRNYNHIGGKFEYMVNKTVGLGIDYTFAKSSYTYIKPYYENINGFYVPKVGNYAASITKQRVLARVNFHFANGRTIDPYATLGIGYYHVLIKHSGPDIDQERTDRLNTYNNDLPISVRMGIGMRYFFIPNLGICVEAGIGGPAVQIGISGKF